ncbi:hypothetical protein AB0I91_39915 [Actinosynnema sp. NPDC049800]
MSTGAALRVDNGLTGVVDWFRGQRNLLERFGGVLRNPLDEVLDFPPSSGTRRSTPQEANFGATSEN